MPPKAPAVPVLATRGTNGLSLSSGPPDNEPVKSFVPDTSKTCRCMRWSPTGEHLAWANGSKLTIVKSEDWSVVASLEKPRVSALEFSPKGTYLATWEVYTTSNTLNLNVYETATGKHLGAFEQRKQLEWEPFWSGDEAYFSTINKNDVIFYKSDNLKEITNKFANQRVQTYSLSPAVTQPFHALCFIPGKQGQPSHAKLFEFPKFDHPVGTKSFFQVDRVEMHWNKKGTAVLLLAFVDVDKSSYYGKSTLFFLSTKGDTSIVTLSKEGPIHSVAWSPLSTEFTVVFGVMPAKAAILNLKCEVLFDIGHGRMNSIYYNPQGNIMLLCGFGNLPGHIDVWDAPNRKSIGKMYAPDTTHLEWSPQGTHFLTATTSPRLRVSNGFKLWHHSGSLIHEQPWNAQEELWEVSWQRFRDGTFKTPAIVLKPVAGIASTGPQVSKEAYRPPGARGRDVAFKLNAELDSQPSAKQMSKASLKNQKKRENKKAAKASNASEEKDDQASKPRNPLLDITTDDPELRKKLGNLKKTLKDIERLKEERKNGKQLEKNQLEKIEKESSVLEELKALAI
ncbi:unnamed protein product [Nesidiocoris tenuis]|uniref:Eukaryotic translation initiation factor 2A n=1 Tax=Nesidiocoris tenuis TaxID=355587 RepID=A0A6H5GP09_9HEMI|nr:unnamed protein product [Nesidiocoris tenuis]